MKDQNKEKEQLRSELVKLRKRITELEEVESLRGRVEEELLEREKLYRTLVETMSDGLVMIDENSRIIYANDRFCEMLGYSRSELIGRLPTDFSQEADHKIVKEQLAGRREGKADHYEIALIRKDGQKVFVHIAPRPIFSTDGLFKGSFAVITDITERKRAEEALLGTTQELELRVQERTADLVTANEELKREITERKLADEKLRESEERHRTLVENIDLGINLIDANHTILMVNGWSARFFDKPASYFIGKKCFKEFEQSATVCPHCPGTQAMTTRQSAEVETEGVLENGSHIPVRIRAFPTFGPDGTATGFIEVVENISENKQVEQETKKMEAKLLQAKKMEAIATLSGGVARELDNLFQTVQGYVERLLWDRNKDDPIYQELLDITHAALRGARLTRKLLTFSGSMESKKRSVDLNQEVTQAQKLLNRTMPAEIELEIHLADDLKIINSDPAQMEQILLSLALNAKDAMPEGGKITIGTESVILDKEFCRRHPEAEPGEYVMLIISDTGHGIGQETLVHVFDPFYTKKNLDDSSGLGLSMVYGIVKNHGGFILCSSESGVGTTFKIYFPATKKEVKLATRIEMEV